MLDALESIREQICEHIMCAKCTCQFIRPFKTLKLLTPWYRIAQSITDVAKSRSAAISGPPTFSWPEKPWLDNTIWDVHCWWYDQAARGGLAIHPHMPKRKKSLARHTHGWPLWAWLQDSTSPILLSLSLLLSNGILTFSHCVYFSNNISSANFWVI